MPFPRNNCLTCSAAFLAPEIDVNHRGQTMTEEIYMILYCSRNRIESSAERQQEEIRTILASSRRNNSVCGITGALLFNTALFAQVLEGPLAKVEETFERIQRDLRHDDVVVLENAIIPGRDFPEWSMAFAGIDQKESAAFADFNMENILSNPSASANGVRDLLRSLVVQEEDYALSR
jgi:hypothetical protein